MTQGGPTSGTNSSNYSLFNNLQIRPERKCLKKWYLALGPGCGILPLGGDGPRRFPRAIGRLGQAMIVTVLIIGISLAMFAYWFRYTVVLILRTGAEPEYASKVAAANRLKFVEVRNRLHAPTPGQDLGRLHTALREDYQALKYLLGHAATAEAGYTAEQRLLMLHFRVLTLWFGATRSLRPSAAKFALLEMSGVLEYFANVMGHRFVALAAEPSRA